MTQRHNYWSIGEVLSLLQDEFPEVTISKIRFLESQGLIDPERTPSGYRRFYQSDFDRLQWILTQQRDHYLPLKVIRDRLDAGEEPFLTDEARAQDAARAEGAADDGQMDGQMTLLADVIDIRSTAGADVVSDIAETPAAGPAAAGSAVAAASSQSPASVSPAPADVGASAPSEGSAESAVSPASPELPSSVGAHDAVRAAATETSASPSEASGAGSNRSAETTSGDARLEPDESESQVEVASNGPSGSESSAAADAAEALGAVPSRSGAPAPRSSSQAMADTDPSLALTLDELAEASGCDVAMIRELERFGLVAGRTVGPTVLYDGETLMVARHAAQFRSFGLDPRHLRTFRVGAEREVALLAQVVEPLRHRRDPETRRKSVETMEDLTDLAASLRAILMRQITREQLPPM